MTMLGWGQSNFSSSDFYCAVFIEDNNHYPLPAGTKQQNKYFLPSIATTFLSFIWNMERILIIYFRSLEVSLMRKSFGYFKEFFIKTLSVEKILFYVI